jgi:hypothetical protein
VGLWEVCAIPGRGFSALAAEKESNYRLYQLRERVAVSIVAVAPVARERVSPLDPRRKLQLVLAVVWLLDGIFTGAGTDPNSGPLLALLAVAFWPVVPAVTPAKGA